MMILLKTLMIELKQKLQKQLKENKIFYEEKKCPKVE